MSLRVDPVQFDRAFDPDTLLTHAGWVRRLAHELVPADAHLADDLAQETYRVALEHAPSTDRPLAGWLGTVLRNLLRQEHRARGRRTDRERDVARPEAQPAAADHDVTLAIHHDLVRAVMSLDEPYRETIVLRFFEELSPTAIARKQQVPVATVKTRLSRALEQLRRKLDRSHGGDGRAWIAALIPHCKPGAGVGIATIGALIMGAKLKIAAAVVVVLVIVTAWSLRVHSIERDEAAVAGSHDTATLAVPDATKTLDANGVERTRASALADSAVAPKTDLDVLVLDESGVPIADMPVMLLDAKNATQSARTDAQGHAGFQSRPGRGALFLHRQDDAPRRVELETSAGARRVQLPQMAELSGTLRENGRPLSAPIMILLFSRGRLFPGVDLPSDVGNFLGLNDDGAFRPSRQTSADGTFRYSGLPDTWSGQLVLPRTWAVSESQRTPAGDQVLVLGAPVKNLVIEVEHLPHLSGRIVDAKHEPAAGAGIEARIQWSDRKGVQDGALSGPDGRFEVEMGRTDLDEVTLKVIGHDDVGTTKLTRKRSEIDASFDLGDIVLVAGSTLRVHVTDADGRPIEGAAAFAEGFDHGTKTNAEGDCAVTNIPEVAQRVRVIAKGYWGATITLPASSPDPITLSLKPCNRLTIRTRTSDGRAPGPIRIGISSSTQHLFPDSDSDEVDTVLPERIVGKARGHKTDGAGKGEARFAPDESGILTIEALVRGVPLRLRVADATDQIVQEVTIAPLGEREDRHEEIVLDRSTHPIRGIVRDETGAPVPDANLDVSTQRGMSANGKTDADGRFVLDPTFAEAIDLGVRKDGFALVRLRGIRLQDPPADIVITLEHGRRVKVSVVDARSRPVDTGNLSVFDPISSSGWPSRPLGPGLFEVVDLPAHEIELRLYLSGKQYVQLHDPRVAQAVIEVPVHGRVVVTWSTDRTDRHIVTLVPKDSTLGELASFASQKPSGEAVFESVLPGEWHISLVTVYEGKRGEKVPEQSITVQPDTTVRVDLRP